MIRKAASVEKDKRVRVNPRIAVAYTCNNANGSRIICAEPLRGTRKFYNSITNQPQEETADTVP